MLISEIKEGMLLKLSGYKGEDFALVVSTGSGLAYTGEKYFGYMTNINSDFVRCNSHNVKIEAIYDIKRETWFKDSYFTPVSRVLLWERKEPKEMTVAEIEKALGYPVKIVKD